MRPSGAAWLGALSALAVVALSGEALAQRTATRRVPTASLSYRYTTLALPGAEGTTHAVALTLHPLRWVRGVRWLRWGVGLDGAWREGPNGHTDAIVQATLSLGWQGPFRALVPWVAGVGGAGFEVESRFGRTYGQLSTTLGVEAGVDLRVVGVFGLGVSVGWGRVTEGEVYHDGFWLRASLPIF